MSSYEILFAATAFVLGSCIGSFLNVCIYRMPRDLKVNEPARSFCPSCKYQIPFYHNIPLFSWLVLRGKCANCGSRIAFRYFGVELLTALLFLAVWWRVWMHPRPELHGAGLVLALPYWLLVSLFVAATFIDFEHYIIPDQITWGGAAAGVVLSFAIPTLHSPGSTNLEGGLRALIGAAAGYGLLWLVVKGGKLAFGRKRIVFDPPATVVWRRHDERATIETDGKTEQWEEFFPDEKAVMRLQCESFEIAGQSFGAVEVSSRYECLTVDGKDHDLNRVETFSGKVKEVFFERDAMGFGDVKFMACIGAFLGWQAVIFTLMAASSVGAVVGLCTIAIGKREWSAKIPFGPYLAFAALIWLFFGPELLAMYLALSNPNV
jgi:leader peptidase (prepilin peptidase) / N-methyltransferase